MNINDRVISSYIVMCLTGIDGSDPDYIYDLVGLGIVSKDPVLNQVAEIAKDNPRSIHIKEIVSGLVLGKVLEYQGELQKKLEKEVKEMEDSLNKKMVIYSFDEGMFFATVWQGEKLLGVVSTGLPKKFDVSRAEEYFAKKAKEKWGSDVEVIKA